MSIEVLPVVEFVLEDGIRYFFNLLIFAYIPFFNLFVSIEQDILTGTFCYVCIKYLIIPCVTVMRRQ